MLKQWMQWGLTKTQGGQAQSSQQDEDSAKSAHYLALGLAALAKHADPTESSSQYLEQAQNAFQQALEYQPGSAAALSGLCKASLGLGQYALAERQAQMALVAGSAPGQEAPYAEAAAVLGTIKLRRGEYQDARISFSQALYWNPYCEEGSAFMGWGLAQWSLSRAASTSTWQRALLMPQAIAAIVWGVGTHRIHQAFHPKQLGQAISRAWGQFEAKALQNAGEDTLSLQALFTLAERFPGHAGLGLALAKAYLAQNDTLMAGFWFQKVLNRHPGNLRALSGLLELAQAQEDADRQVSLCITITQWRPANADAWCHLANAYGDAKNYLEAVTAYKTALHLGRDNKWKAGIANALGHIYMDIFSDLSAAQAYFEMARLLNPSDVANYKELGELYYHSQAYGNAELLNRQAISLEPDDARLHAKLAYLYKEEGRIEAAMASYRQAMVLDASYTLPLHNLGTLYLDTCAEPKQAIELFKQALEAKPDDALAAYNLGRAYSLCGNRIEAARSFQQAQYLNETAEKMQFDSAHLTACLAELFD